jgi:hypothetical protein
MGSDRFGESLLSQWIALPVCASDAPDRWPTRTTGSFLTLVVVASYHHNVRAHPAGAVTMRRRPSTRDRAVPRPGRPDPRCLKRSLSRWSPTRPSRRRTEGTVARPRCPLMLWVRSLREITRSIVDYVKSASADGPRDVMMVYMSGVRRGPLGRTSAAQPACIASEEPSVLHPAMMVTSVPRQLGSNPGVQERFESTGVGSVRCGT